MIRPLLIAFSMYSRIPVPVVDWDEKSMRYAICFFPFVGLVIGVLEYVIFLLCERLGSGYVLRVCLMAAAPLVVTGGIHMDGFIDTADALSSHAERQRKLEIMSDPHIGAFAVIYFGVYMLVYTGLLTEVRSIETVGVLSLGFFLSRALSGIFYTTFPNAKSTGLAAKWSEMTSKRRAVAIMCAEVVVCALIMLAVDVPSALLVIILSAAVSVYHRHNCMKNFGGITGDLAGYFLELEELAVLLSCVIGGRI